MIRRAAPAGWRVAGAPAAGSGAPDIAIAAPLDAAGWRAARAIVAEYGAGLGVDLAFQDFARELDQLADHYAPPRGILLLATIDGALAGCCALRPLDTADYPDAAEMKRLYVRRAFRRFGLGHMLAEATMDAARRAGYASVLLDTLDDMEAARALYAGLGFVDIPPYYHNPVAGAHYLKADL